MDPKTVHIARDSLSRSLQAEGFLDRFYELFMASSPDIRDKFKNTDFAKQKKVLSDSLFLMLSAAGTTEGFAHDQLASLTRKHSRSQLDIRPEFYETWLDCLIATLSEKDDQFSEEVEQAWRESLRGGIDLLSSGY